jgi:hypothetical protein
MNKNIYIFLAIFFPVQVFCSYADVDSDESHEYTFDSSDEHDEAKIRRIDTKNMIDWIQDCKDLRVFRGNARPSKQYSAFRSDPEKSEEIFSEALQNFIESDSARDGASWLGDKYSDGFAPFAQKLDLKPGSKVIFHGDFHGDIHSFMNELIYLYNSGWINEDFVIIKDDFYMVFLGDYVDRGVYGAEVIYTLLRLKQANPDRVFMVRGNHEDSVINKGRAGGFMQECTIKFSRSFYTKVTKIYDIMPVVIYVGCENNFLQCCHGGMEPGYNPTELLNSDSIIKFQLLGELKRSTCACEEVPESETYYTDFIPIAPVTENKTIGFMWHDFNLNNEDLGVNFQEGRGLFFSKNATENLLRKHNSGDKGVRGVFRAHQHHTTLNPMMKGLIESRGVYKLWNEPEKAIFPAARSIADGLVWTFNVAPNSAYGIGCGFSFDAFAILTVASSYEDWQIQVVNTNLHLNIIKKNTKLAD